MDKKILIVHLFSRVVSKDFNSTLRITSLLLVESVSALLLSRSVTYMFKEFPLCVNFARANHFVFCTVFFCSAKFS